MPVAYKDYYDILGVPRKATEEEIRQAFRKLARKYHPDVARDTRGAEDKFKEINEAYEVLSDPQKRAKYDALGADWRDGASFRPPRDRTGRPGPSAGTHGFEGFEFQFGGTGFSDFFEQLFGAAAGGGRRRTAAEDFASYSERGQDVEADIMVTLEEAFHGSTRPISLRLNSVCERCQGTGQLGRGPCPACSGTGESSHVENYQVKIPPGVREGQRLRLPGRGQAGLGQGATGDLYLRVRLARHPDFRVEGHDLYHDLEVAPWEAVLGKEVSIPTLAGRLQIKIPAGSQRGQRLRLRGRGLPAKNREPGDLFVILNIQVPATVSDEERSLWQQLALRSRFNPRS